jgi:uncharacterized protein (TIGR02145 family)
MILKKVFKPASFLTIVLFFVFCEKEQEAPYQPMTIKSQIQQISEYGLSDGKIDITILGGESPFDFVWSNSETCEDLENLCPGIYSLVVTDAKSKMVSDTFKIIEPAPDSIKVQIEFQNPQSTGSSDGKIILNISGGYQPFSFLWSNGQNTQNLENIPAGKYVFSINDSRGQQYIDSVFLSDFVADIDGNKYTTVKLGEQTWMQQNLRVFHSPEGNKIEAFVYNNDSTLLESYGCLYTWNTIMNGSTEEGTQGICPCGWHVPSDEDFKKLEMFLGMSETEANATNIWRGQNIGTKLKTGGSSGYNAMLAGRRAPSGMFSLAGRMEYMWTSSEYGSNAWRRCLDLYTNDVGRWNTFSKEYGFSLRCVKND